MPKTVDCVFISYSLNSTTYTMFDLKFSTIANNTTIESTDEVFP